MLSTCIGQVVPLAARRQAPSRRSDASHCSVISAFASKNRSTGDSERKRLMSSNPLPRVSLSHLKFFFFFTSSFNGVAISDRTSADSLPFQVGAGQLLCLQVVVSVLHASIFFGSALSSSLEVMCPRYVSSVLL